MGWAATKSHIWSVALLQPQSLMMAMAPVTTKGSDDRVAQSRFCASQAAVLVITGPATYQLQHLGEQAL